MSERVTAAGRTLRAGTRVEVRNTFDGSWGSGFEVADAAEDSYRIRRMSDNSVLPVAVPRDAVRRERKRETWWM